jgi:hypothetical protein
MTDLVQHQGELSPRPDLLDPVTDSWVASIADVVRLSEFICGTTFVPQGLRGSAAATAATILYGREIGIPPITALQTMHVVNGKVGMAAELMRARVLAAGHDLEILEHTSALCRIRGRRLGSQTWTEVQWSMGDAQRAKLGGDAWTKYPRAMLLARASSELCTAMFPDVTKGMAALEALDDTAVPTEATAAPSASQRRLVTRAARPQTPPREDSITALPTPPADPPVVATPHPQAPPLPGEDEDTPPPQSSAAPVGVGADPDPDSDPREQAKLTGDGPATQPQVRHIMVLLRRLNMGAQREERLAIGEAITQRRLDSFSALTVTDAGRLITTMLLAVESANPRDYMRWLVDEGQRRLAEREAEDMDPGVGGE